MKIVRKNGIVQNNKWRGAMYVVYRRCLVFGTTIVNEKFFVMGNSLACIMCVIILHGTTLIPIV